jgi:regulator of nonsense transcripts 2
MYLHTKMKPPMEIEYLVQETFELLRPKALFYPSYVAAAMEVNRRAQAMGNVAPQDDEDERRGDEELKGADAGKESDDESESDESSSGSDQDDDVIVRDLANEADSDEAEKFDQEFAKMLTDSLDSRKHERKNAVFDVPVPLLARKGVSFEDVEADDEEPVKQVTFSLLTKKGNKAAIKAVALPADSDFVLNTQRKVEAELEEKRRMKQIVLDYEARERQEAQQPAVEAPVFGTRRTNQRQRREQAAQQGYYSRRL